MAAVTSQTLTSEPILTYGGHTKRLWRESGIGAAATDDTLTTTLGRAKKLRGIFIVYSAAPTFTASVTVDLDSGQGASYDIVGLFTLTTADASGTGFRYMYYIPGLTTVPTLWTATGYQPLGNFDMVFGKDDQLIVNVPGGGGAITSKVTVLWEELR